jgi:hypothetical protein
VTTGHVDSRVRTSAFRSALERRRLRAKPFDAPQSGRFDAAGLIRNGPQGDVGVDEANRQLDGLYLHADDLQWERSTLGRQGIIQVQVEEARAHAVNCLS